MTLAVMMMHNASCIKVCIYRFSQFVEGIRAVVVDILSTIHFAGYRALVPIFDQLITVQQMNHKSAAKYCAFHVDHRNETMHYLEMKKEIEHAIQNSIFEGVHGRLCLSQAREETP